MGALSSFAISTTATLLAKVTAEIAGGKYMRKLREEIKKEVLINIEFDLDAAIRQKIRDEISIFISNYELKSLNKAELIDFETERRLNEFLNILENAMEKKLLETEATAMVPNTINNSDKREKPISLLWPENQIEKGKRIPQASKIANRIIGDMRECIRRQALEENLSNEQ